MNDSAELSPRGVVAAAQRAMLAGDVEAFVGCFAEEAVLEFSSSLEPAVPYRAEGREAIRRMAPLFCRRFFRAGTRQPRFDAPKVHETGDPESVVLAFEASAGSPRHGRSGETQVWRVRGGRVLSLHDYLGASAPHRTSTGRGPLGSAWG
jgi:ketosteroid isomerase-like protein